MMCYFWPFSLSFLAVWLFSVLFQSSVYGFYTYSSLFHVQRFFFWVWVEYFGCWGSKFVCWEWFKMVLARWYDWAMMVLVWSWMARRVIWWFWRWKFYMFGVLGMELAWNIFESISINIAILYSKNKGISTSYATIFLNYKHNYSIVMFVISF